jgi:hypothetical protein
LREHGCRKVREGGNHTIWESPDGATASMPRHNENKEVYGSRHLQRPRHRSSKGDQLKDCEQTRGHPTKMDSRLSQNCLSLVVSTCNLGCYVLGGGLEPPRLAAYAPQTYVSAISPPEQSEATLASATGGGDASGKALLAWNVWFSRVPEGRKRKACGGDTFDGLISARQSRFIATAV